MRKWEEPVDKQSGQKELDSMVLILRRVLRSYLDLQPEDIEDVVSFVILHYYELAVSESNEKQSMADKLIHSPSYRATWIRSRALDYLRRPRFGFRYRDRETSINSLHEDRISIPPDTEAVLETILANSIVRAGLISARSLGDSYILVLEILIDSSKSGIKESRLAETRGLSPQLYLYKKKKLVKRIRREMGVPDDDPEEPKDESRSG